MYICKKRQTRGRGKIAGCLARRRNPGQAEGGSPSPRSAPPSKLSQLYVPASRVARAARCKPCPVALVPTLGCSASRSQPLDLLKFAIPKYNTGICISVEAKTVLILSDTSSYCSKMCTHTLNHAQTLSLVPRRARARAAGEKRLIHFCIHAHTLTARSGFDGVDFSAKWIRLPKVRG